MTNSTRCALLAKQACTTLSHVVQKITPPSANNFLKLFFALFAMLALNVGNAWGETGTVTITFSNEGLTNEQSVNSEAFALGDYFTVTYTKNGAATNPTYYNSGTAIRCYATKNTSNGNIITIKQTDNGAEVNAYITKVTYSGTHSKKGTTAFTYSGSPTSSDANNAIYAASSKVTTATATLKETGGNANGQFYSTGITIEYTYETSAPPATPYTVKFYKTSTTFDEVSETEAGSGVTPPTMEAECGEWSFQGWSESPSNSENSTTVLSTITLENGKYYPTADVNLYPVYTKTSTGGGTMTWNKVTTAPADWSGEYLIVNSDYAMTSDFKEGSAGQFLGASVTVSNNQVTSSPTDKMIWIVEKNGNTAQYSFKNKSTGTYAKITGTSSKNAALSNTVVWFTIGNSSTSGVWKINSVDYSARCFSYYSSEQTFRTYANSNNTTGNLYKKEGSSSTTYYYSYPECSGEPVTPVASLTAAPTTIDFGTVYQDATVESKTVAVNFANLSGAVTYSGLSTPFSATGTISATGDKITISADASTIGEYSQTLTIASTADSKTAEVTVKMNVVEKPAPTGTFTLHTGALVEGDYVIVSTNSLKAEVNSERLASLPVTISNDEIVDPDATTIWHIAKSGEYWTLYNANKAKYAASTGAKNKAALQDDATDDKALWSVTGTSTYEFVNKKNTEAAVNANLRYNSQNAENSRWACYSTSTGAALSLYRKAGTKYNVNISATTNGTVTADPTSAEAGTTITLTVTPAGGYVLDALTVTDASSNPVTVTDNKFTMPASDVTVSATFKENEKPAATLTLSKNGVEETFPGSWKQDDVVTLPSITSDCVKEFVGWSANPTCNVAPEYAAGDSYTLTATAQTLYAVYADAVEGGSEWKETPISDITATDQVVVTMTKSGTTYALFSGNGTSEAPTASTIDIDIENKIVTSTIAQQYIWNIATNEGNYTLYPNGTTSTWLYCTNTNDGVRVGTNSNKVFTIEGNYLKHTGTSRYVGVYIAEKNPDWRCYTSNTGNSNIAGQTLAFYKKTITYAYSNYSTTCAAAPKAEVTPTEVTATAAGAEGNVTVTYENVNTENVAVALYNDDACTEEFTADWLTASLDGDKNITYTVAENTTYAERKAYIQLTAPETTGATEPAVVVIPVTQAGKDKVFASLEELVAAITPTTEGVEVTVTLTNEVIQDFYTSNSYRNGIALNVPYQGGVKVIEIYCKDVPAEWVKGGKVSGTITCPWKLYNSTWELCPTAWTELTYTAPATVKSIAVSGTPTKTTYVDGEAFDPTGLVVTATMTDDSTEPIDVALVDWTFDPETLSKGETSVSVVATYNTMASAAYEVTGLTVIDIPTKTVDEFIAAEGGRCYLEGIVSDIDNTTYGNFNLTDASGTIYVYGCLNEAGESKKFAELGVKNGDKIKVIAEEYKLFEETKQEAIDVQYVSHISAATITIADITMEVGQEKAIEATITPDAAKPTVQYAITSGNEYITLDGTTITAVAAGEATITATVAEGETYLGNSVDFTVTVTPESTSDDVVILAEYNGNWYALKATEGTGNNSLAALEVTYFNGTLYNVEDGDKPLITWERVVVGDKVTFKNGENYLTGGSSTALTLANASFEWTYKVEDGQDTYIYEYEDNGTKSRTFLFYKDGYFKNYATSNAKPTETNYSGYPVVTAPVYATSFIIGEGENTLTNGEVTDVAINRSFTAGKLYTISLPFALDATQVNDIFGTGTTLYQFAQLVKENGELVLYFSKPSAIAAATPYLIQPTQDVNGFEVEDVTICTTTNNISFTAGATTVTMKPILSTEGSVQTNGTTEYWLAADKYLYKNANTILSLRALFDITTSVSGMPPRCRVALGENAETGIDNITSGENTTIKLIENGQLIIIRNGEKFNAQGQKL